ncbi:hypothetical protein ACFE04_031215 [Oxalis oulophora]
MELYDRCLIDMSLAVGELVGTKNNAEDTPLQTALDWACGPGGADCTPIQQGGPCYDSTDITRTASYAFNDYCLKNGMTEDACNFDNTAALTSLNPIAIWFLWGLLDPEVSLRLESRILDFCGMNKGYGSCKFKSSTSHINGTSSTQTQSTGSIIADDTNGSDHNNAVTWFCTLVFVHLLFIFSRII